jgi:hypothetical protein
MQRPAQFHHESPDTFFPQAEAVLDDATTLDTAIDVLDAQLALVQGLVPCILNDHQLKAGGFKNFRQT